MSARRFVNRAFQISYSRCLIFVVALILVFALSSPHFLSFSNFDNILSASAVIGLLALGATFVIASGEIDLSIASVMALSSTICAFFVQGSQMPPGLAVLLAGVVGAACGLLTGSLISLTQAPSFIISLGMLSVARAAAYIIADGTPIYGLPEHVTILGQGRLLGISGPVFFLMAVAAAAFLLMHAARIGTWALIAGDNREAARAMGININRLRIKIFALGGLFSGIAGFVFMARTNCGDPTAGQNYELVAITAVVLGGAKLFGGRAAIPGTLLGVLCLGVLQNGLNLLAVSSYYQTLFVGLVLICAALFDRGIQRS
jgi:ribose/xylose/arabinose/galactoside ABC-type transport system permease subunit